MTDGIKIDEFRVFAEMLALGTETMNFEQRKKFIYDEAKKFFGTMEARNIQVRFIDSEMPIRRMDSDHEQTKGNIAGDGDPRRTLESTRPFEAEETIGEL